MLSPASGLFGCDVAKGAEGSEEVVLLTEGLGPPRRDLELGGRGRVAGERVGVPGLGRGRPPRRACRSCWRTHSGGRRRFGIEDELRQEGLGARPSSAEGPSRSTTAIIVGSYRSVQEQRLGPTDSVTPQHRDRRQCTRRGPALAVTARHSDSLSRLRLVSSPGSLRLVSKSAGPEAAAGPAAAGRKPGRGLGATESTST